MKGRCVAASGSLVLVLAVSARASAQESRSDVLTGKHRTYESTQNFALEVRFAPFQPDVDSDPALKGQTPFANTFGPGPNLLGSVELDWEALKIRHLGSIGPGFGVGYVKASGNAAFANGGHTTETSSVIYTSGEQTSLEIYPMYAVAVLRADVLWREVHIPFVPYAKFGLAYSIWRASNSLGTSVYKGQQGVGGTLGTQLALGLAFNLNVFDEYSAKNFDDAVGVNGTYAFAEYTRADLEGLGIQKDPLRVGGQCWTFGLAFEF